MEELLGQNVAELNIAKSLIPSIFKNSWRSINQWKHSFSTNCESDRSLQTLELDDYQVKITTQKGQTLAL
uniref:Uncharacterized protein n=1 Tax=Rhizophora mucronata TaxID=61149 RepID=A0A2P2MVZ7_RHIMU